MTPLHVGTSYTHDFRFHSKENASGTHQGAWAGSKNAKFVGNEGAVPPSTPRINGGTPPFKIPPVVII